MEDLRLVTTEEFNGINCDFYRSSQDIWMTRKQIGEALGYHNPQIAVGKIHQAHADTIEEFSMLTELGNTQEKRYNTYLYNEMGIMEICRWSRQPKANDFMKWTWGIIKSYLHGELTRKTAITPVEKFLDGIQDIIQAIREENNVFKESVLKILESQQRQTTSNELVEEPVKTSEVATPVTKPKEKVEFIKPIENPRLDGWKMEVNRKAIYIISNNDEYKTKGRVFSTCYLKMKNVYGVCWAQENKEYRRTFGLESQRGRLSTLDVVFNDESLKDLFDSILDGIYENTKRQIEKRKLEVNVHKDWQYYKEKIRELCEKTGNRSVGGTSVYSVIIRKMDVDWSKYDTSKKKTELVREYPELFVEFSKTADKYLEEKLK